MSKQPWTRIITLAMLVFPLMASAIGSQQGPQSQSAQEPTAAAKPSSPSAKPAKTKAKPAESKPTKKEPAHPVKKGWEKFKHSVKQGRTKPACTAEQKSLNQCK